MVNSVPSENLFPFLLILISAILILLCILMLVPEKSRLAPHRRSCAVSREARIALRAATPAMCGFGTAEFAVQGLG